MNWKQVVGIVLILAPLCVILIAAGRESAWSVILAAAISVAVIVGTTLLGVWLLERGTDEESGVKRKQGGGQ